MKYLKKNSIDILALQESWEIVGKPCFREECYEKLSVDISRFKNKGRVVLLGDFNAHVGKGLDSDDVVGPFGEEVCNSNGT